VAPITAPTLASLGLVAGDYVRIGAETIFSNGQAGFVGVFGPSLRSNTSGIYGKTLLPSSSPTVSPSTAANNTDTSSDIWYSEPLLISANASFTTLVQEMLATFTGAASGAAVLMFRNLAIYKKTA
jgi:hypothetical protein